LRLGIQRHADGRVTVSAVEGGGATGHTFVEFATNGVWVPAYFVSSNSVQARAFTLTNSGGMRLFRATQGAAMARRVKESWQRLGVTNYVFHYTQWCLCGPNFMASATVTVMGNEVVKRGGCEKFFWESGDGFMRGSWRRGR
jgi:hypothetical protein